MNVLIVHAHENPDSFCSALAKTAKMHYEAKGHQVVISDLYQKRFNPVGSKSDFFQLSESAYYKYAAEQINAHQNNLFVKDLKEEMDLILSADVLIFNFPFWWFGLPAILKGWVDRVLAYGFAYGGEYGMGPNGRFKGRKAFLTFTTGSPASFYTVEGAHRRTIDDILRNIQEGVLGLVGYEVQQPFIAYGVSRISDTERATIIKNYKNYLDGILSV